MRCSGAILSAAGQVSALNRIAVPFCWLWINGHEIGVGAFSGAPGEDASAPASAHEHDPEHQDHGHAIR